MIDNGLRWHVRAFDRKSQDFRDFVITRIKRPVILKDQSVSEHNIQVIACREGQAVGQESNVRVFDIQHIKGLEFEAVFFVGIDQLAALHPALFDKYLYVGTTRAATYLGVTCDGALPPAIESLRAHFGQDWQAPGSQQGSLFPPYDEVQC